MPLDSEDPADRQKVLTWLREFVPKLEQMAVTLGGRIAECETQLRSSETQRDDASRQLNVVKEELQSVKHQLQSVQHQLQSVQHQLQQKEQELNAVTEERQFAKDQLQQRERELDDERNNSRVAHNNWERQLSGPEGLCESVANMSLTLNQEQIAAADGRQDLRKVLQLQEDTIPRLEAQCEELRKELQDMTHEKLRKELQDMTHEKYETARKYETKNSQLQRQVGIQSEEAERQGNLVASRDKTIEFLRESLKTEKTSSKNAKSNLAIKQRELRLATEERDKLRGELENEKKAHEQAEKQLHSANSQVGHYMDQSKIAQRELQETKEDLNRSTAQVGTLQNQLQQERRASNVINSELKAQLAQANEQLAQANTQQAQLREQRDQATDELARLKEQQEKAAANAKKTPFSWNVVVPTVASGCISWPQLPEPLAGQLRNFRVRVQFGSPLTTQETSDRFVEAFRDDAAADRLREMSSVAEYEKWYCFECVRHYGVRNRDSMAESRICKRHHECFMMMRTMGSAGADIVCREHA